MFINTAVANARSYAWGDWGMGIMRSVISGVSISMGAALSAIGISPTTFNLSDHLGNTLKMAGIVAVLQGAYRMCEFLSLHPGPDPVVVNAPSAKAVNVTLPENGGGGVQVQQDKK